MAEQVTVALSPQERQALQNLCEKHFRNVSDQLRFLVVDAAKREKLMPKEIRVLAVDTTK